MCTGFGLATFQPLQDFVLFFVFPFRFHNVLNFHILCVIFLFQTLEGISDIRDESDRTGMRIVIEVLN